MVQVHGMSTAATIFIPCNQCNSRPAVKPHSETYSGNWCIECLEEQRHHYSAALDEIYMLRSLLAFEAKTTKEHLALKTFPKSRRVIAATQVARMRRAATGDVRPVYEAHNMKPALRAVGASETLTRWEWEKRDET